MNQELPSHDANTTITRIILRYGGLGETYVPDRPRNYYSPLEVSHDIDVVTIVVTTEDPRATWNAKQTPRTSEQESEPISIQVGRNLIPITITAADGRTQSNVVLKVFRADSAPRWKPIVKTAPWLPRDSAGELTFKERMWLFGGYTPATAKDVWSSADGVTWTQAGDIPTTVGVDIPIVFSFRDKIWLADVAGNIFSSPDGNRWSVVTDQAPWKGRNAAGAVVFAGKMWVMGGRKDGELFNDVWSSTDGVHWEREVEHAAWSPREFHHTPVVLDDKIWLLGGAAIWGMYHPFVAYNDVWNSADGKHWELVTDDAPWVPRIWGSSAVYRNRLWVIGGFHAEPSYEDLGDVWYSANGADWRRFETPRTARHCQIRRVDEIVDDSFWKPRHEMSVLVFGEGLWLIAGKRGPLMNDVWQLTIPGLCFTTQPVLEGYVGALYKYRAHADFNRSRQAIRYRLVKGPSWLHLDSKTGALRGIPTAAADADIVIEASDDGGETTQQAYTLHAILL